MKKQYMFDYRNGEASVNFEVDTEKYNEEMAQANLDFFDWDYDKDENPIDEIMKKYAIEVIRVATFNYTNVFGVVEEFKNKEGFAKLDGSNGIKLTDVDSYEFFDFELNVTSYNL